MEHEELESLGMLVDDVLAESVEEVPVTVHERLAVDEDDSGVGMRRTRELARKRTKASSRPVSMAVSGDSDEECLSVLMQLEASDGEVRCLFMAGCLCDLFLSSNRRQEMRIILSPSIAAGRYLRTLLQDSFLGLLCLPVPWASPVW